MAFIKVGKKGKIINLWQKLNVLHRKSEFHEKIKTNFHQEGFDKESSEFIFIIDNFSILITS